MNPTRTIVAALSVLALAGIASGTSTAKNFHIAGPGPSAKVLDTCTGDVCVKVRFIEGTTIRITLEDVSAKQVKAFLVTYKDDVTGKLVTQRVESEDGTTGRLNGLTAEKGRTHIFSVKVCYDTGCSKVKAKFSFAA